MSASGLPPVAPQRTPEPPTGPAQVDWPLARSRSRIAGLILFLLMVIPPLAPLALLWMLAAGAFTVYLYQRRRPGLLPLGAGARMGATAGFVCFVLVIVLSGIAGAILLATMSGPELHKALQDQLQQALARTSDPQVRQTMQGFLTPAGLMLAVVTLFFSLIVFGGLGGLLGSVVMGRKPSR